MTESGSFTLSAGQNSAGESVSLTLSSSVYATSYRDYEEEAKDLVKSIIQNSLKIYQSELEKTSMEWPTGKDFTIDKGKAAIDKLVKVNGACDLSRRTSHDDGHPILRAGRLE